MLPALLIAAAVGGGAMQIFGNVLNANAKRDELNRQTRLLEQQNLLTEKQIKLQESVSQLSQARTENALTQNEMQLSLANIGLLSKEEITYGSMLAKEAASGLGAGSSVFFGEQTRLQEQTLYDEFINQAQYQANKINILTQAVGAGYESEGRFLKGSAQSMQQQYEAQEIGTKLNLLDQQVIYGSLGSAFDIGTKIGLSTYTGGNTVPNIYNLSGK